MNHHEQELKHEGRTAGVMFRCRVADGVRLEIPALAPWSTVVLEIQPGEQKQ